MFHHSNKVRCFGRAELSANTSHIGKQLQTNCYRPSRSWFVPFYAKYPNVHYFDDFFFFLLFWYLGKTTFVQTSVSGHTPEEDELIGMFGVAMLPFDMKYKDRVIPFHIWDVNGHQRYFHLLDSYCAGLDCCIVAFDLIGTVCHIKIHVQMNNITI